MLWRLFQALVVFAVIAANIQWGWTDNGWLASVWAGFAALAATWLVGKAYDVQRFGLEAAGFPGWRYVAKNTALAVLLIGGIALALVAAATFFPLHQPASVAQPEGQP